MKDYIMRMIEQFIQSLVSIIAARKAGKYEEALEYIYLNSQKYLETDISNLITKNPDELLNYFRKGKKLDTDRCLICADLIYEIALISDASQPLAASRRLKILSLHLYENALLADPELRNQSYTAKIARLRDELA